MGNSNSAIKASTKTNWFKKAASFISTLISKIRFRHIWKICLILGKAISGAIVLFSLAHFVPELREKMPDLYMFIDIILDVFNKLIGLMISK